MDEGGGERPGGHARQSLAKSRIRRGRGDEKARRCITVKRRHHGDKAGVLPALAPEFLPPWRTTMLILLIVLLLVFGFGGFRLGPGLGYYGGGGISLLLLILIILLVTHVI